MEIIARSIIGLTTLVVIYAGGRLLLARQGVLDEFEVHVESPTGYNFFMGDFGGVILSAIVLRILTLVDPTVWAPALLVTTGSVFMFRFYSFIRDGVGTMAAIAAAEEALTLLAAWYLFRFLV